MPHRPLPFSPFLRVAPLHAVHHEWSAGQQIHGVVSGHCVFWLVLDGEIEIEASHRHWKLDGGNAFLFALSGERRVHAPRGAEWLSLSLRAVAYDTLDLMPLLPLPSLWRPDAPSFAALKTSSEAIICEWGAPNYRVQDARTFATYLHHQRKHPLENDATRAVFCEGHARALFALLWRGVGTQSLEAAIGGHFPAWMPLALTRLRENPSLGVEELARAVGLSRRHLGREFQKHFGSSPRELLNRRRLEEARQMLHTSDFPLLDIARQTGFADVSHFHRAFKAAFEVPPETYRRQSRLENNVI